MKKLILICLAATMLSSCMAPVISRTLAVPGRLVGSVAGPILGGLGL